MASSVFDDMSSAAVVNQTAANEAKLAKQRSDRAAQEQAIKDQNAPSWYNTMFDNIWTDDYTQGFISPTGTVFGHEIPGASVMNSAWSNSFGAGAAKTASTITGMYNGISQSGSWATSAVPGGMKTLDWDTAGKVSWGQAGMIDAGSRISQLRNPGVGSSLGMLFGYIVEPWSIAGATAELAKSGVTKSNPFTGVIDPNFDPANKKQMDDAFSDDLIGRVTTGASDAAITWFVDPLVLGGKAIKIARFGSEAMNLVGFSSRQLGSVKAMEALRAEYMEAKAFQAGNTAAKEQSLTVYSREVTNGNKAELKNHAILGDPTNPHADLLQSIGAVIDNDKDALTFLGAIGGIPEAITELRATQHAAFDALARAKAVNAYEQAAVNLPAGAHFFTPAVLDDTLEQMTNAKHILDDLVARNAALEKAIDGIDNGTLRLTGFGTSSVTGAKIGAAWRSGKAARDVQFAARQIEGRGLINKMRVGGEDGRFTDEALDASKKLRSDNPDAFSYTNRERPFDWTPAEAETAVARGRIPQSEADRVAAAQAAAATSGPAGYETMFQVSAGFRRVRVWKWLNGAHATGYIAVRGISHNSSIDELNAYLNDSKIIRKDNAFKQNMLAKWSAAINPTDRMAVLQSIESSVAKKIARERGVSEDVMQAVYEQLHAKRMSTINTFKGRGTNGSRAYGVDPVSGDLIVLDPLMVSQLESHVPMIDSRMLDHAAKVLAEPRFMGKAVSKDTAMKEFMLTEVGKNYLDTVSSFWKASVLLRMGYTQRNAAEGWLRTAAVLGSVPGLVASPRAMKNMVWSNRNYKILNHFADGKYRPVQARMAEWADNAEKSTVASLNSSRAQTRMVQEEIAKYGLEREGLIAPEAIAKKLEVQAARLDNPWTDTPGFRKLAEDAATKEYETSGIGARFGQPKVGQKVAPVEPGKYNHDLGSLDKTITATTPTQFRKDWIKNRSNEILNDHLMPIATRVDKAGATTYRLRAHSARTGERAYVPAEVSPTKVYKVNGSNVIPLKVHQLTDGALGLMKEGGVATHRYLELDAAKDARTFFNAVTTAKAGEHGAHLHPYTMREYRDMRLFISADGKTGFALKDGDEIVSMFSVSKTNHSSVSATRLAIEQGGRRADAFDGVIANKLSQHGLVARARTRFSEDLAPKDWNPEHGTPNTIAMSYDASNIKGHTPPQGRMFRDYQNSLDYTKAHVSANDARLNDLNDQLRQLSESQAGLESHLMRVSRVRTKYGKRRLGDREAFAGVNGNLYRDLASADATTRNALESRLGRLHQEELDVNKWSRVLPEDKQYWDELANSVVQFKNDFAAKLALEGKSVDEITAAVASHEGRAYRVELGLTENEYAGRAAFIHDMVNTYLPTEASLHAANTTSATARELEGLLKTAATSLSPIHGKEIKQQLAKLPDFRNGLNTLFKYLGTKPENNWVRFPYYNEVWNRQVKQLATLALHNSETGVLSSRALENIEKQAHAFALKSTEETLYTITRMSNPAQALKYIAPFFPAWENSVKTWAGIIARDPSVAAHAAILWNMPNQLGMVVDKDGKKVEGNWTSVFGSQNNYILVPAFIADGFAKLAATPLGSVPFVGSVLQGVNATGHKIPQQSFNVVSPGAAAWLPGFGPLVTAPVGMLLAAKPDVQKIVKTVLGDTVYQQFVPFGVASGNPADAFLPSSAKKFWERWQGEDNANYLKVADAIMQTAMVDWYKSGADPADKPTVDSIMQKTNDFYSFGVVASLTLPVSLTRMSKYQPIIDKWNEINSTSTGTYQQKVEEFLTKFGDNSYLPLITSSSDSRASNLKSNYETYSVLNDNSDLAATLSNANPELLGMLGMSAPLGQFDTGVHQWYLDKALPGQTGTSIKSTLGPAAMQSKIELAGAWREFSQVKAQVDQVLKQRGGISLQSNAASDIKSQWDQFTHVYMRDKYGMAWGVAYNDFQTHQGSYLEGAVAILNDSKFMASPVGQSPLWATVRNYMQSREVAQAAIRNGADSSDINKAFNAWAGQLKFTSLEFADFYDNYLSNDNLSIGVGSLVS